MDAKPLPEIIATDPDADAVACDGGHGVLGHPIVTYLIPDSGAVTCWYCSRTFVRAERAAASSRAERQMLRTR